MAQTNKTIKGNKMTYSQIKKVLTLSINFNLDAEKKQDIIVGVSIWTDKNESDLTLEQLETIDKLTDQLQAQI